MKNIEIEFSMTSLDSNASFSTVGEIKDNRIIFNDDDDNRHYIIKNKESVEYYKRGTMSMKYVFNLKYNTKGTYEVDNNKFEFDIKTSTLNIKDDEITIEFDLLLDEELINHSTLVIKYS